MKNKEKFLTSIAACIFLITKLANAQQLPLPHAPTAPTQIYTLPSSGPKLPSSLPPPQSGANPRSSQKRTDPTVATKGYARDDKSSARDDNKSNKTPAENIQQGKELVSIDFPNGVNLSDIIKTVGVWTGKNFVLGQGVSGGVKISIISQEPVTKEEAYQAFLSALNISGYTTVETGKIVKILAISNAKSSNIKTYYGENWAPATDEIINHVIPLHYIDVNSVVNQLRPLLGVTQYAPFSTTNSLILTDTGNRIRRIIEIIKLLDDKTSQAQVSIVPINYSDAKDIASKITEIFGNRGGTSISLQKALVDERTNSLILVGPSRSLDDIVRFIQRIDKPALDQSAQALIHVRPLDYADSEKLAQTLQALTQNTNASASKTGAGQRPPYLPNLPQFNPQFNPSAPPGQSQTVAADLSGVKLTSDKSTNSLIIQGSKSAFDELDLIITQLDRRKAQVYIEANIMDLDIQHSLNWKASALGGGTSGNQTIPFGFNVAEAAPFVSSQTATSTSSAATSFAGVGTNAILGILSNKTVSIGGFLLSPGALIFALKSDSNNNVLQTPSMMVSDNETASFQAAQEYSILVQSANPNGSGGIVSSTQKYDVTTSLKVTPQISNSDYLNLKINLQLDNAGPPDPNTHYPNPISKRTAESVVTVQNGQSAVLGGLTQDIESKSEAKVPLLGDIPIIGWLFKSSQNKRQKTSLMLLITPHVVRDAEDLAKIYEQKIKDRDSFLQAFYGPKFKEEEFYAQYPKAEDGAAPKKLIKEKENSSEDKAQKNNEFMEQRRKILPSEETNPINAPSGNSGGGGSFSPPAGGASVPIAPALPVQ